MAPCVGGCALPTGATYHDCAKKGASTKGCILYVFAPADCSGQAGAMCWLKGTESSPTPAICRSSQVFNPQPHKGRWVIKGGGAQAGPLKVYWDGPRAPGYSPMKKQGAIILGIGGDNSDFTQGAFYEGVITSGFAPDATDNAVQANIVAAGYGK